MPDVPESLFADRLQTYFRIRYGESNVDAEHYVTATYDDTERRIGYADLWIETGDVLYAIEIANDSRTIDQEIAQAQKYAKTHPRAVPVVILPDTDSEYGWFDYWATHNDVSILPFSLTDPDVPADTISWAAEGDTHDPLTSDDPDTVGRAVGLRPLWTDD